MKPVVLIFASLPLGLMCCAQKPKLAAAQAEPSPPAVVATSAPSSNAAAEDAGQKIKDLLEQAFKPVYFPFDQAALSDASKNLLAQAGDLMKQAPSVQVLIQGNADERGTEEYNLALGEKRARAVKDYLVTYGIDAARLKIISYGKEKPAALGHDEADWALNRRDDFNLTF